MLPTNDRSRWPARQVSGLEDLRDHADRGVSALDVRHEDEAPTRRAGGLDGCPRLFGLERQGEDHPRQYDAGSEGQKWQGLLFVDLRHSDSFCCSCKQ